MAAGSKRQNAFRAEAHCEQQSLGRLLVDHDGIPEENGAAR